MKKSHPKMVVFPILLLCNTFVFGFNNVSVFFQQKNYFTVSLYSSSKPLNIYYPDSSICSKSFDFKLEGNITQETSIKVINYIKNKEGICDVIFNIETKTLTLSVIDTMDYNSIKGLVKYAHHHFLLEDTHTENIEK